MEESGGLITTLNSNGGVSTVMGFLIKDEGGLFMGYNKYSNIVGTFGSRTDGNGFIDLRDRYGDAGWSASGKK